MFPRLLDLNTESRQSAFLFGPRGSGKTHWVKDQLPNALYIDLLKMDTYNDLLANPTRLEQRIPNGFKEWIIIDEVQKVPNLLNEVHRLIEDEGYRFILTGSSARKLRRRGVNLLAGRARTYHMHPLTAHEMQDQFDIEKALTIGLLPQAQLTDDPKHYLESYVTTYLREEVLQEGLVRQLSEFARFLECASFSQGSLLNISDVAREAAIDRRIVTSYFDILEDLLIAVRIPVFTKRAKRKTTQHPKFYLFDAGVYRTIRPKGPLDSPDEIDGSVLETLVLQHLRAYNDYFRLGYQLFYWRTQNNVEVDFIAYGERGLHAFEVKRKRKLSRKDFSGLLSFQKDYPMAQAYLFYGGDEVLYEGNVTAIPIKLGLYKLLSILQGESH